MDKKQVKSIDYISGAILGIIGMIFTIAFMGVDAYMFNMSPPSWSKAIDQNIFLQPFWLDVLSTIMLACILLLFLVHPSKKSKSRRSKK